MLDISHLFISTALAQTTDTPSVPSGGMSASPLANFVPLILIFAVFYVLIIRPQQKKLQQQEKMIKALQRGDQVVTTGGLHGKVSKLEDHHLMLEIADGIHVKISRSHVQDLASKPQPVADNDKTKS